MIDELVQDLASELGSVRPIELQVVGAQLQTENITTYARYRECGPKAELVKRYLAEVVEDCGAENQRAAELLLYLLTDEKGTRPLKTRAELERDLQVLFSADLTAQASKLDLVLGIFVESGVVVLLPEIPAERYQLVHDYLANFIRQQQEPRLNELIAELEKEREQRQLTEVELKQAEQARRVLEEANQKAEEKNKKANQRIRLGSAVLVISLIGAAIISVLAGKAYQSLREAQDGTRLERDGVNAVKQFEFYQIEALLSAMQAGQDLQKLVKDGRPLEQYPAASPVLALQTILDNIQERLQLKGHTSYVISASFSPDGQKIVTASYDHTAKVWRVESLDQLLARSCNWLHDYLINSPMDLEKLQVCQNKFISIAAAPSLVKEGEKQARDDQFEEAVKTFQQAKTWNPKLHFDPVARAKPLAEAAEQVKKGEELTQKGDIDDAVEAFQKAMKLDPNFELEIRTKAVSALLEKGESFVKEAKVKEAISTYYAQAQKIAPKEGIPADSWNTLCRQGGLRGHAKEVMFACEKAVALAPENGSYRDSRGLARALTGNHQGAIEDFQAYIATPDNKKSKSQRQRWVNALKVGKNPFTKEDIESLLKQ